MLGFSMDMVFQGEPYEDTSKPTEEDAAANAKGKKGKGASDEPEVRMITPEPVLLEKERGREFEFEMGRYE